MHPVHSLLVAALVLIWGTTWAAIRLGLTGVPPFTAAAARFGVSALLLFALAPRLGARIGAGGRRERIVWAANGTLLFFVSYGVVYWAEQWVPSGLAAVIFALFPLFVALLAHFTLPGETLTRGALGGVLLGFLGIATIYSEDFARLGGRQVAVASAVMLLSPLASAVANVIVKRLAVGLHPISTTAVPMVIGTALLGGVARLRERDVPMQLDALSIGCILYLAVLGSAVTFGLYFWLLQRYPATKLALIAYGTPVVAVFVGSVFLHEPITLRVLAGAAAVVAGVALATRSR